MPWQKQEAGWPNFDPGTGGRGRYRGGTKLQTVKTNPQGHSSPCKAAPCKVSSKRPKRHHQLGTESSNTWACGEISHSNHHSTERFFVVKFIASFPQLLRNAEVRSTYKKEGFASAHSWAVFACGSTALLLLGLWRSSIPLKHSDQFARSHR